MPDTVPIQPCIDWDINDPAVKSYDSLDELKKALND